MRENISLPGPDSTGHQLRPVRVQQPSTNSLLEGAGIVFFFFFFFGGGCAQVKAKESKKC